MDDTTRRWLRAARWAEVAFGIIALLFWFALPWPPTREVLPSWFYFLGGAVGAFVLAWRLGRGGRLAWYAAAALSAAALLNALATLPRLPALLRSPLVELVGPGVLVVPAVFVLSQAVVAVCLVRTRHLRSALRT